MIPKKTIEKIGVTQAAACCRRPAHDDFVVTGTDLNDLAALAVRLNSRMEGEELRDWQNRINLMLANAVGVPHYD